MKKTALMKKNKCRMIITAVLIMTNIFFAAGCKKNVGTEQDNAIVEELPVSPSYTIGVSLPDTQAPYYDALLTTIRSDAEENHCTIIVKDARGDAAVQDEQMEQLSDMGISALIVCPVDDEYEYTSFSKIRQKSGPDGEITIVAVGERGGTTDVSNIDCDVYVGCDDLMTGTLCGEDLVKRKPEGGKIIIVEEPDIPSAGKRITGFEKAVSGRGFEVIDRLRPSRQEDYKDKIRDILEREKVDAIVCATDEYALAAAETADQISGSTVMIYASEGSPKVKQLIQSGTSHLEVSGGVSVIQIGKKAVEVILESVAGEKIQKEYLVEGFLIDRENVEVYGTDGWQ